MATTMQGGVTPVDLGVPVGMIDRPATVIPESAPLPEAWARLHHDVDGCGVVVRDDLPIAVLTAGALAERWPAGGPLVTHRTTVHDVLEHPCGVDVLDPDDPLDHAGRRLLTTGLPALPVRQGHTGALRVVTVRRVLAALLRVGSPA